MDDTDVWTSPEVKPDGESYCEYMICYVKNIIRNSLKVLEIMIEIKVIFKLRNNNIVDLSKFIGASFQERNTNRE